MREPLSAAPSHSGGGVVGELGGCMGLVTLDRLTSLNALSLGVVRDITALLLRWQHDSQVVAVILRSRESGARQPVFSAGSDLRWLYRAVHDSDSRLDDYFSELYALCHLVHHYPKPVMVLMDGLAMGSALGLAQAAPLRIVTERSRLAVTDVHSGWFPDAGAGWYLNRCRGQAGRFLALTGQTVGPADAVALGLADGRMESEDIPALLEALTDQPYYSGEQVLAAVRAHVVEPGVPELHSQMEAMDKHFGQADVADVMHSLSTDRSDGAARWLQAMANASPLMLCVSYEHLVRSRGLALADVLRLERNLARACLALRASRGSEVLEGLRAMVIDKDHTPRWNPPMLNEVPSALVTAMFDSPWPAWAHPLRDL